jgi:hypothetical protein
MPPLKPISQSTLAFIFFVFILISGCSVKSTPSPTETVLLPTRTRPATSTPAPTITLTPTETLLPSATSNPTDTPYPPPEVDFSKAKFYTSGFLPDWQYFIAIEAQETMKGSYYAMIDDQVKYTCEILAKYPKRLYCHGNLRLMNDWIDYAIYVNGTKQKVFSGRLFIPVIDHSAFLQ